MMTINIYAYGHYILIYIHTYAYIYGTSHAVLAEWYGSDCEEIPHVQGQRSLSKTVGAGVVAARCSINCEEISHVQEERRSPRKTVGGAKSCLESNPIPARNTQRAQTTLVSTKNQRPHRDTTGQQRTATGAGDLGAVGLRVA